MSAKSHVSKMGASLAVRIPKSIARQWGVEEGSAIEIIPCGDQVVLRKKSDSRARDSRFNPIRIRGGPISDTVLEDRR